MKSKKTTKILFTTGLILITVFILLALCQCKTANQFTDEDNGKKIDLKENEKITIKLESNPTTGYQWNLSDDINFEIISLVSSKYTQTPGNEDLVGAGGYETFTFKVISSGETSITLTYNRLWEDEEPAETFKLDISVK